MSWPRRWTSLTSGPRQIIFLSKLNLLSQDGSSWEKIHLGHLGHLGQDVKDVKDELVVLLMQDTEFGVLRLMHMLRCSGMS
jgi:hypothetical protein